MRSTPSMHRTPSTVTYHVESIVVRAEIAVMVMVMTEVVDVGKAEKGSSIDRTTIFVRTVAVIGKGRIGDHVVPVAEVVTDEQSPETKQFVHDVWPLCLPDE
jgi:hypothetical protein